jgi:hypothetical protein
MTEALQLSPEAHRAGDRTGSGFPGGSALPRSRSRSTPSRSCQSWRSARRQTLSEPRLPQHRRSSRGDAIAAWPELRAILRASSSPRHLPAFRRHSSISSPSVGLMVVPRRNGTTRRWSIVTKVRKGLRADSARIAVRFRPDGFLAGIRDLGGGPGVLIRQFAGSTSIALRSRQPTHGASHCKIG